MTDTETEVYHYAACNDCPLFEWVDSDKDAEISAEKHHFERDHSATWGRVPANLVERRKQPPEGEYNV